MVSGMVGALGMAVFSAVAYEKGYTDGKKEVNGFESCNGSTKG